MSKRPGGPTGAGDGSPPPFAVRQRADSSGIPGAGQSSAAGSPERVVDGHQREEGGGARDATNDTVHNARRRPSESGARSWCLVMMGFCGSAGGIHCRGLERPPPMGETRQKLVAKKRPWPTSCKQDCQATSSRITPKEGAGGATTCSSNTSNNTLRSAGLWTDAPKMPKDSSSKSKRTFSRSCQAPDADIDPMWPKIGKA